MAMDAINAESLLSQLQQMRSQSADMAGGDGAQAAGKDEFKNVLGDLINKVDMEQKQADNSLKSLASGDSNTSIQEVVMKMEQADVSFNLMLEIRNKLVSAYKEILSTQS